MIIAKCNRCGKEINDMHCYRYMGEAHNVERMAFNGKTDDFQLCGDCHKFVQETIVYPVIEEKPNG